MTNKKGKGNRGSPSGMTTKGQPQIPFGDDKQERQGQRQPQIPFGDDKKGKGKATAGGAAGL
jgi:hypothetical protein